MGASNQHISVNTHWAWVVLFVLLLSTFGAFKYSESLTNNSDALRFQAKVSLAEYDIVKRMQRYVQILRSGIAFMKSSEEVNRAEWKEFVASLEVDNLLPGVQGIGFSVMIAKENLLAHEASVQKEGFPDYHVCPEGERDLYSAILFLEPFDWRNQRAFGYDMYSDSVRREAMDRARDSGEAALSGMITLVQETDRNVQPGFLVYLPYYKKEAPISTVEERRAALVGFVYSPFRALDMMQGIFPDIEDRDMNIIVYDGDKFSAHKSAILYQSKEDDHLSEFKTSRKVTIAGHTWTVEYRSSKAFDAKHQHTQGVVILLLGGFVSFLVFFMLRQNAMQHEKEARKAHVLAVQEFRARSRSQVLQQLINGDVLEKVLESIVLALQKANPEMLCSILLVDNKAKRLRVGIAPSLPESYHQFVESLEISSESSPCARAVYTGEPVIEANIMHHPLWIESRALAEALGLASCWSYPIYSSTGEVVAVFVIYHQYLHTPHDDEVRLIKDEARLVALAIENTHRQEGLQLAAKVFGNANEGILITDAASAIIDVNGAFSAITGYSRDEVLGKTPRILSSGQQSRGFYEDMWSSVNEKGSWMGEIVNRRKNGDLYSEYLSISAVKDTNNHVLYYIALFTDITQKKLSEELIWRQANYDTLTGVPNRRMFNDRLQNAIELAQRNGTKVAVIMIDLDRFKEVNDSLGHDMGDILLKESSMRMQHCVRKCDTVARLGGDEFVIILEQVKHVDDVAAIANHLLRELAKPFFLGDEQAYISGSLGITLYPDDSQDANQLLRNADHAMYASKRAGRNRFHYFTEDMQAEALDKLRLIADLHRAVEHDQFMIDCQPMIDMRSGMVTKAEVLIRWNHPSDGVLYPDQFIHLAEESGVIHQIGDWVLQEAVALATSLRKSCHEDFQVSVNISPVQFMGEQSFAGWQELIVAANLNPNAIILEITENVMMERLDIAASHLLDFKKHGLQVAMDDFGTGYSSLAVLKKFDVDYLKIDRVFVENLIAYNEDLVLCEAIIMMAHQLGLRVIAEGVDSQKKFDLLKEMGCDFVQGDLIAEPMHVFDFPEWLVKMARKQ
ncbi:MAG: EAL domain-containing protein [Zetaproteobacteria bacterium]|nr:EAL domain-containing protein [Zetaproteobacteria bacterium]